MNKFPLSTKDIKDTITAAQQITDYAQASITLVPTIPDPPSWYSTISADISTAQSHSKNWLNVLCPGTTSQMPKTITAFNPIFQSKTAKVLQIVDDIKGKISDKQKAEIHGLFEDIISAIKAQHSTSTYIAGELKKYIENANQDQSKLTSDLNVIKQHDLKGAANITTIQNIMGEKFMNSTTLGPCNVIVSIDINISIKINQISSNPQLLAYAFISEFIKNMIANIKNIQIPLQSFFDLWNDILVDYQTLISDLNSASDDAYLGFIEKLDLRQAQKDWKTLADFVATTIPN